MSEPTGTVNTPTEPTPPAAAPELTGNPPAGDGKPTEPTSAEPTLLGQEPKEGDPKPPDANEPKPPAGAPEKYEFKDADKYDATVLGSFAESAKALNLSQDDAQKLLESVAPKIAERNAEQVKAVQQQWREASSTDKEFGGDKLKENLAVAKKAFDQFTTPEDRKFLEETGLGNHPTIIRMLYRAGKAISEDAKLVGGKAPDAPPATEAFYPTMKKN